MQTRIQELNVPGELVIDPTSIDGITLILAAAQNALAKVKDLEPKADAWDELASADGEYAVADAASEHSQARWDRHRPSAAVRSTRRDPVDLPGDAKRWRPYASALDAGYLTERAMPPRLNSDDDLVPTAPQVRVTTRGLERLRVRIGSIETGTAASKSTQTRSFRL